MKKIYIFLGCLISFSLNAQLHDNTWVFGYDNNLDTTDKFGIVILDFKEGDFSIHQNTLLSINMEGTNSSYSSAEGQFHSCSNTTKFENGSGETIEGSEDLMNGEFFDGNVFVQNIISIPNFQDVNSYYYIYQNSNYINGITFCSTKYMYSLVDKLLNNGSGKVIIRNKVFLEDTLSIGGVVTLTKHANGRDWWLLANEIYTNRHYRVLVTPDTFQVVGNQVIGENLSQGIGQAVFSPDGSRYAIYYAISSQLGGYLEIYDFDRCTGLLSNHRKEHIPDGSWGGIAFSPNSRFLYYNNSFKCYQYDFSANDVISSKTVVAEWDGYLSPFPTAFYLMQLAPDGKIYSATPTGTNVLHVIHRPDEAGLACQYEQHAVHLPVYNALSMPNFPNYRLGPIDGSSCDTLGIDNIPVSWWRHERDTSNLLAFEFRDISWYNPTDWYWDFGDGSSSTVRYPLHEFAVPGNYNVCLTVSNTNGTDTRCKSVFAGVSAAFDPDIQSEIQVGPNPFNQLIFVTLSQRLADPRFQIYDITGHLVQTAPLYLGVNEIRTGHLPPGMYFYSVESKGVVVKSGKVVKRQ